MPTGSSRRIALLASAALAASLALVVTGSAAHAAARAYTQATAGNGTFDATVVGTAGSSYFFSTDEKVTADDTDFTTDIYRHSGSTVTLVTPGTPESTVFIGSSTDGTAVLYRTYGSVLPADSDAGKSDIYRFANGNTVLMTGAADAGWDVITAATNPAADKIAYFAGTTTNKFVVSSASGAPDVLTPTLLTAAFGAAAADLSKFWFVTSSALSGSDSGGANDVYEFNVGTATSTLISLGNGFPSDFSAATDDGSHVFWNTSANVGGDVDGFSDIYDAHGGTSTLVSGGTTANAAYYGASTDGTAVFYTTNAAIDGTDTDAATDVYRRAGGVDTLVTPNGSSTTAVYLDAVSTDGSRFAFETTLAVTASDTDSGSDIYLSTGPTAAAKTLESGTGNLGVTFFGATDDLSQVYFATDESLLPADSDPWQDLYAGIDGTLDLVSTGTNASAAGFSGTNADGSHVLIATYERLAATDTDNFLDVYDAAVPAPPSTTTPDTTAPTGRLSAAKKQKGPKKLVAAVSCGAEACTATVSGQVAVGKKRLSVGPVTVAVVAGKDASVTLKLSRKVKKAVAKALKTVSNVKVTVSATVTDAAGNTASAPTLKVKLTH